MQGLAQKDCRERKNQIDQLCAYSGKNGHNFQECFTRQNHLGRGRQQKGSRRSNGYKPPSPDRRPRWEYNPEYGGQNRDRRPTPDRRRNEREYLSTDLRLRPRSRDARLRHMTATIKLEMTTNQNTDPSTDRNAGWTQDKNMIIAENIFKKNAQPLST